MNKKLYVTAFVVFFLLVCYSPCLAFQDVSKFDIQGFRLGMTIKQAKLLMKADEKWEIREYNDVYHYSKLGGLSFSITQSQLGSKIYSISMERSYEIFIANETLLKKFTEKYGKYTTLTKRDCSWGSGPNRTKATCYFYVWGSQSKSHLELKVTQILTFVSRSTNFYLTLEDQELYNRKEQIWKDEKDKKEKKQGQKAVDDLKL